MNKIRAGLGLQLGHAGFLTIKKVNSLEVKYAIYP
jgi:hypothetical protein